MGKYNNIITKRTTDDGRVRKFRSKLECRWSIYLDFLLGAGEIQRWEYEPCFFDFPIRHGITRYMPDFYVVEKDGSITWHECKGRLDSKSMTKLRRFAKYYPDEKLWLIFDGLPRANTFSLWAIKQRVAIDKIEPLVERVVDASVIFRQIGIKKRLNE